MRSFKRYFKEDVDEAELRGQKDGYNSGFAIGKEQGRRLGWRDLKWWAKGKHSITKHELLEELAARLSKPAKRKEGGG